MFWSPAVTTLIVCAAAGTAGSATSAPMAAAVSSLEMRMVLTSSSNSGRERRPRGVAMVKRDPGQWLPLRAGRHAGDDPDAEPLGNPPGRDHRGADVEARRIAMVRRAALTVVVQPIERHQRRRAGPVGRRCRIEHLAFELPVGIRLDGG